MNLNKSYALHSIAVGRMLNTLKKDMIPLEEVRMCTTISIVAFETVFSRAKEDPFNDSSFTVYRELRIVRTDVVQ